jgi:hypothetical protein
MSEPPNTRIEAAALPQAGSRAPLDRPPSPYPAASFPIRVDGPHNTSAVEAGSAAKSSEIVPVADARSDASSQQPFPSRDVPANPDAGTDVRLIAPSSRMPDSGNESHDRFALETGQIAAHLRQQYADIDRREQRLHVQLSQVDQERREQRLWVAELEAGLEEREFAITRQEAALGQRADSCLKLESELKELHETLLRERHSLNVERDQLIIDRDEQAKTLETNLLGQQRELERLRADLIAEHDQAESDLKQQSALLENRHRFQQDHLQRTMQEFEATQNAFRREQQVARTRDEETRTQILLHRGQIDRQREILDERQQSIDRERQVLFKERRAMEDRLAHETEELRSGRAAWEAERDSQKADLRRQQDMLALHADNLETRRQRLDSLRGELEETNRQTLELRLAVEETAAELMQTVGSEVAQRRIDEAHAILGEYYRHTRESLMAQRQELEQGLVKMQQQREEFRSERQLLVEWISQQEEQLAQREQILALEQQAIESRDSEWRVHAQGLTNDKLHAESVIRDLLGKLSEREQNA